ncbi:Hypothetical predicted protein [Prunus dulcis]|uniref:Uncharacterized protein n=1 Tax=Prunus dulcis TaxID=3755 RepID=A0A5E4ED57_PRUDU|nr:Hypothetical predicted protein [Prunus dulcis]
MTINITINLCKHHSTNQKQVTKVLRVPTRPRSKRRYDYTKMKSLVSFIENLGLSPEKFQEKIRQLRYSRDYTFLSSDERHNVNAVKPVDFGLYSALTKAINCDMRSHQKEHHKNLNQLQTSKSGKVESVKHQKKENSKCPRGLRTFVLHDEDEEDDNGGGGDDVSR